VAAETGAASTCTPRETRLTTMPMAAVEDALLPPTYIETQQLCGL
jgi:hypothetical protein